MLPEHFFEPIREVFKGRRYFANCKLPARTASSIARLANIHCPLKSPRSDAKAPKPAKRDLALTYLEECAHVEVIQVPYPDLLGFRREDGRDRYVERVRVVGRLDVRRGGRVVPDSAALPAGVERDAFYWPGRPAPPAARPNSPAGVSDVPEVRRAPERTERRFPLPDALGLARAVHSEDCRRRPGEQQQSAGGGRKTAPRCGQHAAVPAEGRVAGSGGEAVLRSIVAVIVVPVVVVVGVPAGGGGSGSRPKQLGLLVLEAVEALGLQARPRGELEGTVVVGGLIAAAVVAVVAVLHGGSRGFGLTTPDFFRSQLFRCKSLQSGQRDERSRAGSFSGRGRPRARLPGRRAFFGVDLT